jgi:hypothetical protein
VLQSVLGRKKAAAGQRELKRGHSTLPIKQNVPFLI